MYSIYRILLPRHQRTIGRNKTMSATPTAANGQTHSGTLD
jgi:hypothetical protein